MFVVVLYVCFSLKCTMLNVFYLHEIDNLNTV